MALPDQAPLDIPPRSAPVPIVSLRARGRDDDDDCDDDERDGGRGGRGGADGGAERGGRVRRSASLQGGEHGAARGEVRRMRSVLDMKLGAMAAALDAAAGADPLVDAFGIAIPRSTQRHMRLHGAREPVSCGARDAPLLAASPSSLDLSALLC